MGVNYYVLLHENTTIAGLRVKAQITHHGQGTQLNNDCQRKIALTQPQKAVKSQAASNTARLLQTHSIAAGVNALYIVLKFVLRRQRSLTLYLVLNAPALLIEFWFERIARPTIVDGEVKRAGEDLEAKGLTEWMWDVLYWSWGTLAIVSLAGDWAWWLWAVVPLYSAYLAFTTYSGMRQGLGGMMGGGDAKGEPAVGAGGGQSKRQAKMEKRGGQKMQYR